MLIAKVSISNWPFIIGCLEVLIFLSVNRSEPICLICFLVFVKCAMFLFVYSFKILPDWTLLELTVLIVVWPLKV